MTIENSTESGPEEIYVQTFPEAEIRCGGDFEAGVPQALFAIRIRPGAPRNKCAPFPDGQRSLIAAPLGRKSMSPTTVVLNWPAGLGR